MSVLSIIKKGHHTKEQPQKMSPKKAGKQKEAPVTTNSTRYRHVPTHAASDALMGAPAGWARDDAERIREINERRIALAASLPPTASGSPILSPLHVSVNSIHDGSSSSSSSIKRGSVRTPSGSPHRSPSPPKTQLSAPSASSSAMRLSPSFNSLDAELHRALVANQHAHTRTHAISSGQATPASWASPSPMSLSQSASPSACSTPEFGPKDDDLKVKDATDPGSGYTTNSEDEYTFGLPEGNALEMKVMPSAAIGHKKATKDDSTTASTTTARGGVRNPYAQPSSTTGASTTALPKPRGPSAWPLQPLIPQTAVAV